MMVFGVIGVTRTTGTTLEHQIVGWLTVIGSDSLGIVICPMNHFLKPQPRDPNTGSRGWGLLPRIPYEAVQITHIP